MIAGAADADFGSPFPEVLERYPRGKPRTSLDAVEKLMAALGLSPPARTIAVVGTNGKTSAATYLARVLSGSGLRTGLTTSPHVFRWTERVRIDGDEVGEAELAETVRRLDAAARDRGDLRFFDLITLSALAIFEDRGVEAGVFEAGIGGRLDCARCLRPPLVVLTGIGLDHTDLLGSSREQILREKLLVAPAQAHVVSAPLGARLEEAAQRQVADQGSTIEFADVGDVPFRERNLFLAQHAARRVVDVPREALDVDLSVTGRLERRAVSGVEVVVDAAHNEDGWRALLGELPGRFVAAVSISADRPPDVLAGLLTNRADAVVATCAWRGRSLPADLLGGALRARGLNTVAEDDPQVAVGRALAQARASRLPLAVFGSAYFLPHALAALGATRQERTW